MSGKRSDMNWYLAPTLALLRDEVNARWPGRDTSSDGTIGDARHQRERSDHNPDPHSHPPGVVRAFDLDTDLNKHGDNGPVDSLILLSMIRHPATRYVIYRNRFYHRDHHFMPQDYQTVNPGGDPHDKHFHLSITAGHESANESWLEHTNIPEVDDMPYTEKQLTELVQNAVRTTPITNKFGQTFALGDILAAIDFNVVDIQHNAPDHNADALLHHQVEVMNPTTGAPQAVRVEEALTRASEATIVRQAEGITDTQTLPSADKLREMTDELAAFRAATAPKSARRTATTPTDTP